MKWVVLNQAVTWVSSGNEPITIAIYRVIITAYSATG